MLSDIEEFSYPTFVNDVCAMWITPIYECSTWLKGASMAAPATFDDDLFLLRGVLWTKEQIATEKRMEEL